MKKWKLYRFEDCPNCGGDLVVNSDCPEEMDTLLTQTVCDGEDVKCIECNFKTIIEADEDGINLQMIFE